MSRSTIQTMMMSMLASWCVSLYCAKSSGDSTNGASTATSAPAETTAPTVGTAITVIKVAETFLNLQWGAASDNTTAVANLEYKVVKDSVATTNINTISKIEAKSAGDIVQDWTSALTSKSATGLTAGTQYHFAVIVRDAAGNKAAYSPISGTPQAICGNAVVETGEGCDDGNTTPGDGCSATCMP